MDMDRDADTVMAMISTLAFSGFVLGGRRACVSCRDEMGAGLHRVGGDGKAEQGKLGFRR